MKNKQMKMIIAFVLAVLVTVSAGLMTASAHSFENTHRNTGNLRRDIIAVARTQLGYREGENNDTKYGSWYGLPNQPWCAMFVSWCARQADVPTSILSNSAIAAPDYWYFDIPYYDGEDYTPQSGDLFFTKTFSHVGLVYYVDGECFYTLEGNTNDTGSSAGIGVFRNRRLIKDYYFGVPDYERDVPSAGHICDKATATDDEVQHPHFSTYECSVCSAVNADYSTYNHSDTCYECNMVKPNAVLGDANLDGEINIKDATAIQKHLAGIHTLSEACTLLSDADCNEKLNIRDATAIQKYLAGMGSSFHIGWGRPV